MTYRPFHFFAVSTSLLLLLSPLLADEPQASNTSEKKTSDKRSMGFNIKMPTFGGKQLWADELVHGDWRIQKHVYTGHYRLLDAKNTRHAWGSWDHCLGRWAELRKEQDVPALKPKVVLVLHGLGRSRASMQGMVDYLAKNSDYSVLNVSYSSTRMPISSDAESLAKVVSNLENVEEINFVAHSMGNLVIRHFLNDQLREARGLSIDPRIGRFVMLAPPNQGADLADRLKNNPVFQLVLGSGGREFTKNWEDLQTRLATPPIPFGIIAGGATDGNGRNPLLEGDDDMVVTVEETRLAGAADFMVIPALHTFIMDDPKVQQCTLRFLQHGHFISADERQPIPAEEPCEGDAP